MRALASRRGSMLTVSFTVFSHCVSLTVSHREEVFLTASLTESPRLPRCLSLTSEVRAEGGGAP